ncbi:MAG: bifunctional 5,10-methylenetetrahydrofolate dehydrogenase/5,10-methenyltetrahydrofolate cyclohydrolase [Bdellovibrionota bacterium]
MGTPIILDGAYFAKKKFEAVKSKVSKLIANGEKLPKLAVILVGDDEASKIYVSNKEKKAKECFIETETIFLDKDISKKELEEVIFKLNLDTNITGILLQLPLPNGFDKNYFLSLISPNKDVDCLTPINTSKLFNGKPSVYPCTPKAVMELISLSLNGNSHDGLESFEKIDLSGKNALVIGRSMLVGLPLSFMLLRQNATVTISHSRTKDLALQVKDKDIIVSAVGKEKLINSDNVKDGAILIDVGINRASDNKVVGDIDFESFKNKDVFISPVPNGVGPMTIATLMENVVRLNAK